MAGHRICKLYTERSVKDETKIMAYEQTNRVHYRTATIDGFDVFYREAGPADAPAILLLHGFPTSSNMFRNLIPQLAAKFHVVAPDYPGFGQSSMPDHKQFAYTFNNLANVVEGLIQQLDLKQFAIYVMDYGAPVGYRLALRMPERITAVVAQNGNAYEEGLTDFWNPIRKYWADPSPANRAALHFLVDAASTRWQYEDGVSDPTLLDPTAWLVDQAGLDRRGNDEIQLDLFYDYRTNLPLYPDFQQFLRERKPPLLIVWGQNDKIFPEPGARAYLKDVPETEMHLFDTGHFALETHVDRIAILIDDFLTRKVAKRFLR